eukprot:TRINITY_DN9047_c0_g1_i10.p1 TRINITY_DN9047_c0_g1~~TRINITY_DN9047_c0_g1_i10.p1  ORF type:complete len:384 (-),score=59.75 TRINITY_DN9047_c0_g1_i10:269-1420(-)
MPSSRTFEYRHTGGHSAFDDEIYLDDETDAEQPQCRYVLAISLVTAATAGLVGCIAGVFADKAGFLRRVGPVAEWSITSAESSTASSLACTDPDFPYLDPEKLLCYRRPATSVSSAVEGSSPPACESWCALSLSSTEPCDGCCGPRGTRFCRQPYELQGRSLTASGEFEVWTFPLRFDSVTTYDRRFGVDIPEACKEVGALCPILVDFHGAYDSLYSQRAWTKWYRYQEVVPEKFILVTPEGSPDAVVYNASIKAISDCNHTDDVGCKCVGGSLTSWNVLDWGKVTDPVEEHQTCAAADKKGGRDPLCFWSSLEAKGSYNCFETQLRKDAQVCGLNPHFATPTGLTTPTETEEMEEEEDDYYEALLLNQRRASGAKEHWCRLL